MTAETTYKIGNWVFTPSRNELSRGRKTLRLEDRAGRALEFLCQNAGSVISKDELIKEVWQGRHLSEQSVPVVISNLRKTFVDGGEKSEIIETIPKRGYRVIGASPVQSAPPKGLQRWLGAGVGLVVVILLGFYFLQGAPTEARKPGIILTLNDIRNATGDEEMMNQVIAMSEAGSYYLSKIDNVLLIRHWWNIEADDPTGGIFERYGKDAPIYHVSGTLINEGGQLSVALFLNDPKTDEVLWSEAYEVNKDDFLDNHLANLGKVLAYLGVKEQIPPPGPEVPNGEAATSYWLGLYMWHLGLENAAGSAEAWWLKALEYNPGDEKSKAGLKALWARWPETFPGQGEAFELKEGEDDPALLVQAGAIALYLEDDPEKAGELAQKALFYSPNDHAAYALMAESLVRAGNIEAGLRAIREAQILAPFSKAYPEREARFSEMLEGRN